MRILILANNDIGLYKFRKELLERLISEGHDVCISVPAGEYIEEIKKIGCSVINTDISRHGTNIIEDYKLIKTYKRLIKTIKPGMVFTYTIKPNIYGGIASKFAKVPYVANITGLGTAVENKGILQVLTINLYRFALNKAKTVFFQNAENEWYFTDQHIALEKHKLLPGSGVNLDSHKLEAYPEDNTKVYFLFVGRLMKDKGYLEYVRSAKIIKEKNPTVEFHSIGFTEPDFREELEKENAGNYVTAHGQTNDVHAYMKKAHVIVLPSYHEGMANVLLEAAATGRPVIASNIPGCKETFDDGITGIACEPKSVDSLVCAINKFLTLTHEERLKMGILGRKKVEEQFSRQIVVDAYSKEIE